MQKTNVMLDRWIIENETLKNISHLLVGNLYCDVDHSLNTIFLHSDVDTYRLRIRVPQNYNFIEKILSLPLDFLLKNMSVIRTYNLDKSIQHTKDNLMDYWTKHQNSLSNYEIDAILMMIDVCYDVLKNPNLALKNKEKLVAYQAKHPDAISADLLNDVCTSLFDFASNDGKHVATHKLLHIIHAYGLKSNIVAADYYCNDIEAAAIQAFYLYLLPEIAKDHGLSFNP